MNNALTKLNPGTVQIRGETIDLTSHEGQALIVDFAMEEEQVLSIDHIKRKHDFSDNDLAGLVARFNQFERI